MRSIPVLGLVLVGCSNRFGTMASHRPSDTPEVDDAQGGGASVGQGVPGVAPITDRLTRLEASSRGGLHVHVLQGELGRWAAAF